MEQRTTISYVNHSNPNVNAYSIKLLATNGRHLYEQRQQIDCLLDRSLFTMLSSIFWIYFTLRVKKLKRQTHQVWFQQICDTNVNCKRTAPLLQRKCREALAQTNNNGVYCISLTLICVGKVCVIVLCFLECINRLPYVKKICSRTLFWIGENVGPILDDRLKEKLLKP